ncbi:MAG: hypothetical protein PHY14_02235 [Candidatus Gracilibacteria bacterium]|nr:hypothetical protein [Candidatus Gracilibacteria bacterium]
MLEQVNQEPTGQSIVEQLVNETREGLARRVDDAISDAIESIHQEQVDFEYQMYFFATIFDMDREIWESLFPGVADSEIIQEKIPEMVKYFVQKNKPRSIGVTCYYLQDKNEVDNDPFVRLGWYIFSKDSMEEIRSDGKDMRSWLEKIMRKPVKMSPGEFLHYFVGEHGVTEKGIAIIDTFNYSQGNASYLSLQRSARKSFESLFPSSYSE